MQAVKAIYVRMNPMLEELGLAAKSMYEEIIELRDKLQLLGISWEGAANDEYMKRLMEDMYEAEMTAVQVRVMHTYLYKCIEKYQTTETQIGLTLGDMKI